MVSNAFVLCKVRHSVSLSPCHAVEPRVGIEQDLTEQLMRYSEPLQGVVLSFSDVQLDKPYGVIVNEMPFIHCKVLAKALVFRPSEGMQLRGVVNKIGSNHIGMLFAGVFNGSVTEAELPKGYVHNYAQDCWLGEDGSSISVEDEVDVKVLRVHVAGAMVAIEATMRFEGAGVKKATVTKKAKKAMHLNLSADEPVEPVVEPIKANMSKKSKKVEEAAEEVNEVEPIKAKKVKKTKKVVETAEEVVELKPSKVKKTKKTKKVAEEVEPTKAKKRMKVLDLSADEPVEPVTQPIKAKENKKSKKTVEEVAEVKTKKSKKRKHEQPAVAKVVEEKAATVEVEEEVEVKPKKHKHKDKDAKKKKHKKSKHD